MSEEDKKSFVVRDRRMFSGEDTSSDEGDKREDESVAQKEDAKINDNDNKSEDKKKEYESASREDAQLPKINFPTFIFSLHSSVILNLGLIEDPGTGKKTKNLPAAKQTIDILGMLEEKTRGNLTNEEENMLKTILYDLRLAYVKEKG